MRTGDNGYIKELNYKLILNTLRTSRAASRADLSRLTGLTRSTCSVICERMLMQGIIIEIGTTDSTGGRPPILLQINNRAGAVLGLKIMEDQIAGATVDLGGNIIEKQTLPVSGSRDPELYLTQFEQFVQSLLAHHKKIYPLVPLIGIGIGISGRVSSEGVLMESSILKWRNVPLRKRLEKRFKLPVHIENDVNTFAIGEKYFGSGREFDNFLCLSVGEGIGLGIIINGNLYSGSHHGAGEIGHTRISFTEDAPFCSCGKQGCLEAFISDRALTEMYRKLAGSVVSVDQLINLAKAGDQLALDIFAHMGNYLGTAISSLINLFDPQALILGGERTNAAPFFLPSLEQHIAENCVYDLAKEVALIVLNPSNDDWIRGVAALAIAEFFSTHTQRRI
ncbi:MAG: ROK family transcriptional regulator [Bacilli bacterium]